MAAYRSVPLELSEVDTPLLLVGAQVSAGLFRVLDVAPHLGRTFTAAEDLPGADVVVLSWRLWQARFGGDPSVVGRSIVLDRRPYTVVGVMPAGFEFPRRGAPINNRPADVWIPLVFTAGQRQARGDEFNYSAVGRLKPGTSLDQARAELARLAQQINDSYPPVLKSRGSPAPCRPRRFATRSPAGRERPLLLLLAAVGLVLLVTCANTANLVLSRAAARTREVALRSALGSSRGRLLQLLLTEAALLSVAGGVAGVAIAMLVVAALPAVIVDALPAAGTAPIDVRVLAFASGLVIATALLFALIPLVTVERGAPGRALQEEAARTTPGVRRHRVQAALVVSTVALACVLLAGAGLFIRSFTALMATDAGFTADRVLAAVVTLPRAGYASAASVRSFHDAAFREAAALPGVRSAALTTDLPLESYERRTLTAEGVRPTAAVPRNTNLSWLRGPYFATLGIRLRGGRHFTDDEDRVRRNVVIVNHRLAAAFWPGQDAVGKRLRWGLDMPQNPNPWLTVVGVVDDVADGPLGVEPYLHAYEPFIQFPDFVLENFPGSFGRDVTLALRTDGDPRALASALRAGIARIDPQLAVRSMATMEDRIADSWRRGGSAP